MSEKRDYYEVLGLERNADGDTIRRTYRKLALKYHPDRNPGDANAEAKFKEATEAYSVLSDEQKRAQYDRFGHAGLGGSDFDFAGAGVGDILNHFQDMFADFFGGFGGFGGGQRRQAPQRGQDIGVEAAISLKDSMLGCKHELTVHGAAPCDTCGGSGAKKGTSPARCSTCGGRGQVATQRGFVMFSSTCPQCRGKGQIITDPCGDCGGQGYVRKQRKVLVTFPAGIDSGQRLRVPGQGMPGPAGTPPGDLYVDVELEPHPTFQREGYDLGTRQRVSFAEAALGTRFDLELPDEAKVTVKIEAGTQPGTVITLRGKGVPALDRSSRGNLHVIVEVDVPKKLSRRAKKLLEELSEELTDVSGARAQTLSQ